MRTRTFIKSLGILTLFPFTSKAIKVVFEPVVPLSTPELVYKTTFWNGDAILIVLTNQILIPIGDGNLEINVFGQHYKVIGKLVQSDKITKSEGPLRMREDYPGKWKEDFEFVFNNLVKNVPNEYYSKLENANAH